MPTLIGTGSENALTESTPKSRREISAERFDRQFGRSDGHEIVPRLADGLTTLRDLFFRRIHDDVESEFGMDSMLSPVSVAKSERITKYEIEIYQAAEAAFEMCHRGYVAGDCDAVADWLLEMRLGAVHTLDSIRHRLTRYLARDRDNRERFFSNVLVGDFPEAARAPLVLFQLYPLAIDLVTALAFRNPKMISEFRRRQICQLPAIADCRTCRGQTLDNGETCRECGNPLWTFRWLTAD